jgi:hypothetical protein
MESTAAAELLDRVATAPVPWETVILDGGFVLFLLVAIHVLLIRK